MASRKPVRPNHDLADPPNRRRGGWGFAICLLAGAVLIGGIGGMATTENGRAGLVRGGKSLAVETGAMRARAPRAGDDWGGCNEARAAGTAPIYRGEPGYREDMDGDGDGIACEAPRGF